MSRRVRRKANKAVTAVGLFVIALIGLFGITYMLMGTTVYTGSDVRTVYAYTSGAVSVQVSDVETSVDEVKFTLNGTAAYVKIEMEQQWKDAKGMFTAVYIDLTGIKQASSWELAKVYLSDGTTDLYIGSISYDAEKATLDVESDDVDTMDDFKPVYVLIKFYDSQGNLVDALAAATHTIGIKFTVPIKTDTITAFASSLVLAFIVCIRRFVAAVSASITSFLFAITTNSAILTILGALVIVIAFWYLSENKKIKLW